MKESAAASCHHVDDWVGITDEYIYYTMTVQSYGDDSSL